MRVAFISDIHSNKYALQSVVEDIEKKGIDRIYSLGDIVGYHSFPNEVITILKERNIMSIKGNHDRDISEKRFDVSKESDYIKEWTFNQLTDGNIRFLTELPEYIEMQIEGYKIGLVHGSISNIEEYLYEDRENTLRQVDIFNGDILVCAHTHVPYIKKYGSKMVINTGSVGKPKIGRPNATYITADFKGGIVNAEIVEVEYDILAAVTDMQNKKLPEKFSEALKTGLP